MTGPDPIRARELAVPHGFFTRTGGVSSGLYASLNAGLGSDDAPEAVAENRRRIAEALGAETLVTAAQVHGVTAVRVDGPFEGARPDADAILTTRPGLAIGVLTADCAPILLADAEAGVVAAAHAGWRGTLDGVAASVVAAMIDAGAERERIRAVVGPTISLAAYEVGPEFVERFLDDDSANHRFFAGGRGDRAHFDLPSCLLARLGDEGVAAHWTGHCTYRDAERFFSYRRATHEGAPDYGRMAAAIALPA